MTSMLHGDGYEMIARHFFYMLRPEPNGDN